MSRVDTLKKQFPHLDISLLDIICDIDGTESHKYSQLLCKIFNKFLTLDEVSFSERQEWISDNKKTFERLKIPVSENQSVNYIKRRMMDMIRFDDIELFQEFKSYIEKNQIPQTDITKYSDMNDIRNAVSFANLKSLQKKLEKQVHKEFEDDKWLMVRPLSFESSSVYGAGTKWCTTYKHEKEYFFKYFYNGSLVYIINKLTGYKVALHIEYVNSNGDISFWNAEDSKVDFLSLEIEEYLIPHIKKIVKSKKKNSDFLTKDELFKVATICNSLFRLQDTEELIPIRYEGLMPVPTMRG